MIELFNLSTISMYPQLRESMHRLRYRMFVQRHGWDIPNIAEYEVDQYDTQAINPLYLIGRNEDGEVVATCRFLQSTGPYMIKDHFRTYLEGKDVPETTRIWESNRITVDSKATGRATINFTAALMAAHCELGLKYGVDQVLGIFTEPTLRLLTILGAPPQWRSRRIHLSDRYPSRIAFFDLNEETGALLRRRAGISGQAIVADHINHETEAA